MIHLKNIVLYTFWGGGMRKYVLYTQLNVDNFEWPLTSSQAYMLKEIHLYRP